MVPARPLKRSACSSVCNRWGVRVSCPGRRSPAAGRGWERQRRQHLAEAALDGQGWVLASQALTAPPLRWTGVSWGLARAPRRTSSRGWVPSHRGPILERWSARCRRPPRPGRGRVGGQQPLAAGPEAGPDRRGVTCSRHRPLAGSTAPKMARRRVLLGRPDLLALSLGAPGRPDQGRRLPWVWSSASTTAPRAGRQAAGAARPGPGRGRGRPWRPGGVAASRPPQGPADPGSAASGQADPAAATAGRSSRGSAGRAAPGSAWSAGPPSRGRPALAGRQPSGAWR